MFLLCLHPVQTVACFADLYLVLIRFHMLMTAYRQLTFIGSLFLSVVVYKHTIDTPAKNEHVV